MSEVCFSLAKGGGETDFLYFYISPPLAGDTFFMRQRYEKGHEQSILEYIVICLDNFNKIWYNKHCVINSANFLAEVADK